MKTSNKVCDTILLPRQWCTLQPTSSLTVASCCQRVCDRDEELYELNKDSAATISELKSQLSSSNKAHAMLEKNHHDLEINLRKVIQDKSQQILHIDHAKAKAGRERQTSK